MRNHVATALILGACVSIAYKLRFRYQSSRSNDHENGRKKNLGPGIHVYDVHFVLFLSAFVDRLQRFR